MLTLLVFDEITTLESNYDWLVDFLDGVLRELVVP